MGDALEGLLLEDALVLAHPQRCAVNEAYACAFAHQHALDQYDKFDNRASFQLDETVVRHNFREQVAHVLAHVMKVEVFQEPVSGIVKQYEDSYDFRIRHHAVSMVFALLCRLATWYGVFLDSIVKNYAEIITH